MMKQDVKDQKNTNGMRREWGCYIYYNKQTGKYSIGNPKYGEFVKGVGAHGSVDQKDPRPQHNGSHLTLDDIPVSHIHTHTPLSNEPEHLQRKVGASIVDQELADRCGYSILVIDYIGVKNSEGNYVIRGGYDVDAPMKFYIVSPTLQGQGTKQKTRSKL